MQTLATAWSNGDASLPDRAEETVVRGTPGIWCGFECLFQWAAKAVPTYQLRLGARDRHQEFHGTLSLASRPLHTATILGWAVAEGWRGVRCGREKSESVLRLQVFGEIFCTTGASGGGTTWYEALERIKRLATVC